LPPPPIWRAWPCSGSARRPTGGRWPEHEQPALHAHYALVQALQASARASTFAPARQSDRLDVRLFGSGVALSPYDPSKITSFGTSLPVRTASDR
jgi:hypothetical protein